MHLIYIDESGNTGNNLGDVSQPVFVLCALLVPEDRWLRLEHDLQEAIDPSFPAPRPAGFEVHATALRNGEAWFRRFPVPHRLAFVDAWLKIAARHELHLVYRAIEKRRYHRWLVENFGAGVTINPHLVALPLIARVVDELLGKLPGSPHGIIISDEDRATMSDVEKAIRLLRGADGTLKLRRIIEKGFFADSRTSLPLQLCDVCTYYCRKLEESRLGHHTKPLDAEGVKLVGSLIHRGDERFQDTIAWVIDLQKKGAARE